MNIATFHAYAGWSPPTSSGSACCATSRGDCTAASRHRGGAPFHRPLLSGDYKVIPNGVDLREFAHVQPVARYKDGTANILFVGRFESRKGISYLLKAYRVLRRRGYNCRLLVIGGGPGEREVRRYIATRRLTGVELLAASAMRTRRVTLPPPISTSRRRPVASRSA
jgi:glycosyltransferase involved in cell wall biosynthesis